MKQFLLITILAISLASCSTGNTPETAPKTDSTAIADTACCVDTCTVTADSCKVTPAK